MSPPNAISAAPPPSAEPRPPLDVGRCIRITRTVKALINISAIVKMKMKNAAIIYGNDLVFCEKIKNKCKCTSNYQHLQFLLC